jgi:hypothetical protein
MAKDLRPIGPPFNVYLTGSATIHFSILCHLFRLAHALARSFNFQGRVKKIFHVLTDDKVGAGPRLLPNSLSKPATSDPAQPMETDTDSSEVAIVDPPEISQPPSLSAKLAAQKRKAAETADGSAAKSTKSRR